MTMFNSKKKKIATGVIAGVAVVGLAGGAVAYFTTGGSGQGNASVGTSSDFVIHQDTIAYSATPDDFLYPGTSATVTFTVDNTSSGNQFLNTISLASVTSDKPGCNSAAHPTWFSATSLPVNLNYAPGSGQTVTGSLTVTFVNSTTVNQDVCKGAILALNYSSN